MQPLPYIMRDLNRHKVDHIMEFNVAAGRARPRSVFEIAAFIAAVLGYLAVLALSA